MKEESWREPKTLGLISVSGRAGGGSKPRYTLSEISGGTDRYRANPGGPSGIGQFVFAFNKIGATNMGQCVTGNNLTPWGLCCYFNCNQSSACSADGCVCCGFSMGNSSTVYVALGAFSGCGATLYRRIA